MLNWILLVSVPWFWKQWTLMALVNSLLRFLPFFCQKWIDAHISISLIGNHLLFGHHLMLPNFRPLREFDIYHHAPLYGLSSLFSFFNKILQLYITFMLGVLCTLLVNPTLNHWCKIGYLFYSPYITFYYSLGFA